MSSLYYNCLYPETKSILDGHDPIHYNEVLSRYIAYSVGISKEIISRLNQDLITLLGFSHGDFGIATTKKVRVTSHNGVINLSSNSQVYGQHILSLIPLHKSFPTLKHDYDYDLRKSFRGFNSKIVHKVTEIKSLITDTYVRCSEFLMSYFYSASKNCIASSYKKSAALHMFYFYKDKRAKVTEGKNIVHSLHKLEYRHTSLFHTFKQNIYQVDNRLNPEFLNSFTISMMFRYLSNSLWRDLNFPVTAPSSSLHVPYHRLKYAHTNYGTKGLRKVFFKTSSKPIQNIITRSPNLLHLFHNLERIDQFESLDTNIKLRFLQVVETSINSFDRPVSIPTAFAGGVRSLLDNSFSINRIISAFEQTSEKMAKLSLVHHITDIHHYTGRISYEEAGINSSDTIRNIHDKLSEGLNRKRDSQYYGREIPTTEDEKKWDETKGDYIFKVATLTDELATLGNKLSICVRSYDRRAIEKSCTIVGVYLADGTPFACIEVSSRQVLIQVKLHRNRRGSSVQSFADLVREWATEHNINFTNCYDLT